MAISKVTLQLFSHSLRNSGPAGNSFSGSRAHSAVNFSQWLSHQQRSSPAGGPESLPLLQGASMRWMKSSRMWRRMSSSSWDAMAMDYSLVWALKPLWFLVCFWCMIFGFPTGTKVATLLHSSWSTIINNQPRMESPVFAVWLHHHSPPTVDWHHLPRLCGRLWALRGVAGSIPVDSLRLEVTTGQFSHEEAGGWDLGGQDP